MPTEYGCAAGVDVAHQIYKLIVIIYRHFDICGVPMSGADLSARGAVQRGCRRDALCGEAARDSCGEAPPWHLHATRSQRPAVRTPHMDVLEAA